ncbi:N-acetyltransferase DgcN [Pararhodospirillum photometricum]|nr:N-acetyltransferase DgcN [Pararhodospirillum photometricum]
MALHPPYLLFLGDAPDALAAKTANGIRHWRPEWCRGQFRLPGCQADLGLPDLSLEEARAADVRTLVVGVANRGGVIGESWREILLQAVSLGFDIAAGLHERLVDVPGLAEAAQRAGVRLHDVRHPSGKLAVASGKRRAGKRVLAVGTDCSVGKMYTMLAMEREMKARGLNADFRATGQTGIFIAGSGISVDAVVADFISGAAEALAPENTPDHWDLVEGQGSLFHASYAGVSLGLLHGAQPDWLVMCHEPGRAHMRGLPGRQLPSLDDCIKLNLDCARLTNPDVAMLGLAFNTAGLSSEAATRLLEQTSDAFGLPCVDPVRTGVGALVTRLTEAAA